MACFSTRRASSMSGDRAVSPRSRAHKQQSARASTQRMDDRYFVELAAAFVRGRLGERLDGEAAIARGLEAGLRLHKFKRNSELPRVKKVIGLLRGLSPATLLDVGSGRGTFLWPLVDALPHLSVTSIDRDQR